jgi:hypothetical protein
MPRSALSPAEAGAAALLASAPLRCKVGRRSWCGRSDSIFWYCRPARSPIRLGVLVITLVANAIQIQAGLLLQRAVHIRDLTNTLTYIWYNKILEYQLDGLYISIFSSVTQSIANTLKIGDALFGRCLFERGRELPREGFTPSRSSRLRTFFPDECFKVCRVQTARCGSQKRRGHRDVGSPRRLIDLVTQNPA